MNCITTTTFAGILTRQDFLNRMHFTPPQSRKLWFRISSFVSTAVKKIFKVYPLWTAINALSLITTVILLQSATTFPDWINAAAAPSGHWVVPFRALKLAKIKLSSSSDKSNSWIQHPLLIQHSLTAFLQDGLFCFGIWVFCCCSFLILSQCQYMTWWIFFLLKNNLCSTTKLKNSECWKTDYVILNKKHPTTGSALYQNFRTSLRSVKSLKHRKPFCQSVYSVKNSKLGFFFLSIFWKRMYLMTVKFPKSQCVLLLWFMLRNNCKMKKTQNFLSLCDSPNNTEQTGTSHKSASQSEISGFNVFSSPTWNINMLPGTGHVLYQSSHCQYFQFQLKYGTGYFHYISCEDKAGYEGCGAATGGKFCQYIFD